MFSQTAEFYDTIYLSRGKDYAAEARSVHELVQKQLRSGGKTLLDVACGTAIHTGYFAEHYQVEGLDLDDKMLAVARKKMPNTPFHQGDLIDFELPGQFDVITCLFSSIGYVKTLPRLHQALANLERHLKPGGVLVIEPWFAPEDWHPGRVHATFVDQPNLKIARMNLSGQEGTLSYFVFHYLIGTPDGIDRFEERHELGLFTTDEYLSAFRACRLEVIHDPRWLNERGLYLGLKGLS
jgi:ubiquinone/menaquinone biosynthesis C-methylase UbiE